MKVIFCPFNRTILELKQGKRSCFISKPTTFNRTILELKHALRFVAFLRPETFNRTILELKHEAYCFSLMTRIDF